MIWQLPIGNRDCFLAVEESHRNSASSFSKGEWPLTFILVIFVWKSFAMVLFAGFISVAAGNKLVYHLSACQMTILDVQIVLNRLVAMRLTNFRTLSTCFIKKKTSTSDRSIQRTVARLWIIYEVLELEVEIILSDFWCTIPNQQTFLRPLTLPWTGTPMAKG